MRLDSITLNGLLRENVRQLALMKITLLKKLDYYFFSGFVRVDKTINTNGHHIPVFLVTIETLNHLIPSRTQQ